VAVDPEVSKTSRMPSKLLDDLHRKAETNEEVGEWEDLPDRTLVAG